MVTKTYLYMGDSPDTDILNLMGQITEIEYAKTKVPFHKFVRGKIGKAFFKEPGNFLPRTKPPILDFVIIPPKWEKIGKMDSIKFPGDTQVPFPITSLDDHKPHPFVVLTNDRYWVELFTFDAYLMSETRSKFSFKLTTAISELWGCHPLSKRACHKLAKSANLPYKFPANTIKRMKIEL